MGSHANVLIDLILKNNCRRIAEIGVWKGRTMRAILRSECSNILEEYWAIDRWKVLDDKHGHMGYLKNNDWNELYCRICKYMVYFPSLKILRMSSIDAIKLFFKENFDLVFIDASHFYEDVLQDIKIWLPLVKKGGILCGHDYGSSRHRGVKRAVEEIFKGNIILERDKIWIKKIHG